MARYDLVQCCKAPFLSRSSILLLVIREAAYVRYSSRRSHPEYSSNRRVHTPLRSCHQRRSEAIGRMSCKDIEKHHSALSTYPLLLPAKHPAQTRQPSSHPRHQHCAAQHQIYYQLNKSTKPRWQWSCSSHKCLPIAQALWRSGWRSTGQISDWHGLTFCTVLDPAPAGISTTFAQNAQTPK